MYSREVIEAFKDFGGNFAVAIFCDTVLTRSFRPHHDDLHFDTTFDDLDSVSVSWESLMIKQTVCSSPECFCSSCYRTVFTRTLVFLVMKISTFCSR